MSIVKPSLQTRFHIDFDWWRQNENDWHVHLRSLLCPEHEGAFSGQGVELMDFVDPETAEVHPMDGLQHTILVHCARQPGFVTAQTQLVEAVFRTFLANGNSPLSPVELAERLNRPANTILTTLAGPRVYRGLRPARE
ncbi:MAG: hypothetical protein CO094_12515 [Anaerolineae bacterium CG_4_9_14_3_um_filter_57_17]|nr:hypothetical protein [bacterium]OIO85677.1 MAG: hypothetical protein AUK01_05520 [Anaerolineae bacterium CG2_30_57_67]PJB64592.1 MAG: hypothetical protein CO094_12515 [Anaerolineae bacterium CG_4_9_14_3_um_filter_57_17]